MRLYAGSSGFSYKEWKGPFYPEKLKNADMLRFYASKLDTVEINYTFRRMPKAETMAGWREQASEGFRFVLKASQRITHRQRLKDVSEPVGYLWKAAQELGEHLGPILFQLPPFFKKDLAVLETFLGELPEGLQAVLEFRNPSWDDEQVCEVLRAHNAALCTADNDPKEGKPDPEPAITSTADFGYLRLRRSDYDEAALDAWAEQIRAQPWKEAFVFFKHEDEGAAPRMALAFQEAFESLD